MKTTICMIRHGQTDWNKQLLIQGRLNNKLNDKGRMQAKEAGNILKKYDPNWDIIICSPLDRAYETAKIIKETIGLKCDIIKDEDIIERDFGDAEGQTITDEIYDLIKADKVGGLETSIVLKRRANDAINKIAKTYNGKKILLISHSHFIKGFFISVDSSYTFSSFFANTSLNYVVLEDNKIISLCDNKKFE